MIKRKIGKSVNVGGTAPDLPTGESIRRLLTKIQEMRREKDPRKKSEKKSPSSVKAKKSTRKS